MDMALAGRVQDSRREMGNELAGQTDRFVGPDRASRLSRGRAHDDMADPNARRGLLLGDRRGKQEHRLRGADPASPVRRFFQGGVSVAAISAQTGQCVKGWSPSRLYGISQRLRPWQVAADAPYDGRFQYLP